MAEKILIIAGPEFEDVELLYPYYRLLEEGFKVDVMSHPRYGDTLKGKHGYSVRISVKPGDARVEDYKALVLPGGRGPERIRVFPEIVGMVREFVESGKPVAAICHGPQLLVSASIGRPELLRGRRVTSVPTIKDDLLAAGAEWVDQPVVVDGNLVTARIPPDIPQWMKAFLEKLRQH